MGNFREIFAYEVIYVDVLLTGCFTLVSYLVVHNRSTYSKMGECYIFHDRHILPPFKSRFILQEQHISRVIWLLNPRVFECHHIASSPICFLENRECNRKSFLLSVASFPATHESLPQMKPSKRFKKSISHWSHIQISPHIPTLYIFFIHNFFCPFPNIRSFVLRFTFSHGCVDPVDFVVQT
jgi:hypothetical protein